MFDSAYFVKSTLPSAFIGSFQHFAYATDILKMCIKKFDAEKLFIPLQNGVLGSIPFSACPKFRQHLKFLLYNCVSFCLGLNDQYYKSYAVL